MTTISFRPIHARVKKGVAFRLGIAHGFNLATEQTWTEDELRNPSHFFGRMYEVIQLNYFSPESPTVEFTMAENPLELMDAFKRGQTMGVRKAFWRIKKMSNLV